MVNINGSFKSLVLEVLNPFFPCMSTVKHAIDAMTSFHDRLNVMVWTSVKD